MLRVLPYGATKAALEAMSAIWAKELEGAGITVNVLVPVGPTGTKLIADGSEWPRDKLPPGDNGSSMLLVDFGGS